jgi:hypothetical protein
MIINEKGKGTRTELLFLLRGSTALVGLDLLAVRVSRSHSDKPKSVGLF